MSGEKHKVFVSYKFSDAVDTRDSIIKKLGDYGQFYKGERGYVALDYADATMKQYLGDMIFDSTVTLVVISPNVRYSQWVSWEIRYSLENHTRNDRTSGRNGIVCVIQNREDSTSYTFTDGVLRHRKNAKWAYNEFSGGKDLRREYLPQLIIDNMAVSFRPNAAFYSGYLDPDESNVSHKDYCVVVAESTFLSDPDKYINEAFNRAVDDAFITKTR